MKKYAIIVAGGSGSRIGQTVPKQFLLLHNKPVLWYTVNAFLKAFKEIEIILVLPEQFMNEGSTLADLFETQNAIHIVAGGQTRFHSVKNGLALVHEVGIVFVHDGVRCLVSPALILRCFETANIYGNAVPAVSSSDSIRLEEGGSNKVLDRSKLRIIQTPQTFLSEVLKKSFEQEYQASFTDEATVVERTGVDIHLVEGEPSNIKITVPFDLFLAEKILAQRQG